MPNESVAAGRRGGNSRRLGVFALCAAGAALAGACERGQEGAQQVGTQSVAPTPGALVSATAFDALAPDSQAAIARSATRAKRAIPGWGDQQRLAVLDSAGPADTTGRLRHSALATIAPHDELERFSADSFAGAFRLVATVTSDSAYPKLGMLPADTTYPNTLWLRRVSGTTWQARMTIPANASIPPGGSRHKFFAVIPTTHSEPVPGTARWIWRADDESVWVRCGSGCCELGNEIAPPG